MYKDFILINKTAYPVNADNTKLKLVESILKDSIADEQDTVIKDMVNEFIEYDLNDLYLNLN